MDGPHRIFAGFVFKRFKSMGKKAGIIRVHLIGALKSTDGDHQVQRHPGQRIAGGALNGPAADDDIFAAAGNLGCNVVNLAVI